MEKDRKDVLIIGKAETTTPTTAAENVMHFGGNAAGGAIVGGSVGSLAGPVGTVIGSLVGTLGGIYIAASGDVKTSPKASDPG